MQRDLNIYLPAMEKQLNILDTLYEVHGLESDEVVWLQQDHVLKLQGLCLLTKISFVFGFFGHRFCLLYLFRWEGCCVCFWGRVYMIFIFLLKPVLCCNAEVLFLFGSWLCPWWMFLTVSLMPVHSLFSSPCKSNRAQFGLCPYLGREPHVQWSGRDVEMEPRQMLLAHSCPAPTPCNGVGGQR